MAEGKRTYASIFGDESLTEINKKVMRTYQAALDAFNAGNWDATVIACGKVLEETARSELPYNERGGTLAQLLDKLSKKIRLEQPIAELASAAKDSKGLGGFFDLEKDNDPELARATLTLIEAFITYTYLFKAKVQELTKLTDSRKRSKPIKNDPPPSAESVAIKTEAIATKVEAPKKGAEFDKFEVNSGSLDPKRTSWSAFRDSKD